MSGIFGIYGKEKLNASNLIHYGLYALQHRGQISCGIGTIDGEDVKVYNDNGLVSGVFAEETLNELKGSIGIGHIKYAFSYETATSEVMPLLFEDKKLSSIIALDGNILGKNFKMEKVVESLRNLDGINAELKKIIGAFSIVYMDREKMIAHRDRWGIKPLCLGKIGESYIVSSESCALDASGAEFIRDFEPGDTVIVDNDGYRILNMGDMERKLCLFESVYIARPDSYMNFKSVYMQRYDMGKLLFKECPTEGDVVIGAPDSGLISAIGYSDESKISYELGIIKNRYVGRTFISQNQTEREKGVRIKLNPIKSVIEGKELILVDDSIVRGTTMKRTVKMLKDAGAKKVHVRVSSPPVTKPCNLSIDTPNEDHLIGHGRSVEEIRKIIGADSLYYLSLEALIKASGNYGYCTNCFNGVYPIKRSELDGNDI